MKRYVHYLAIAVLVLIMMACGRNDDIDSIGTMESLGGEQSTAPSQTASIPMPERILPVPSAPPDTVEGFSYYLDERLTEEIREIVLKNRSRLFVNANTDILENPEKYMALDYDVTVDNWLVETLENSGDIPFKLIYSYETIEEELHFLMTYLKYAYGAYQYYGGDEVFLPLKDRIIDRLKGINEQEVRYNDYAYALYEELVSVIIDCHFAVGDKHFNSTQKHGYFVRNSDYAFTKNGAAFYMDLDGRAYELISVDGAAPVDKLIPYLDGSGHVVWIVGYPSTTVTEQSCSIILYHEESGEIREAEILVTGVASTVRFENLMYNEYDQDGIRIVESRRCYPEESEPDMHAVMGQAAEKLRDKNIIIVDLRNNSGGSDSYANVWLSSLLQNELNHGRGIFTSHVTKTTYYTHGQAWAFDYDGFMESGLNPSWKGPNIGTGVPYANKDRLFVVLSDHYTCSSGEGFVDILRQTENTLIVGTNTSGAYATGNVAEISLPYSKLLIRCGYNLHLEPDLSSIEAIGIQPDIWCDPNVSLERVLQFIENFKLTS